MSKLSDTAVQKYSENYNCAQAVASPFWEKYGISEDAGKKITSGFGGGFKTGELCGAASGAIAIIGLKGEDNPTTTAKTKEFLSRFVKIKNATTCKEILGCDSSERSLQSPQRQEEMKADCNSLVKSAVEILESMDY